VFVPPIKCQGIKTKLVPWIRSIVPNAHGGQWIEPFMGSGVVCFNIQPKKAILCDSNPHLIRFYQALKNGEINASGTRTFLNREGELLLRSEGEYYYQVRERFNEKKSPLDFLFLNRSCFNGMIRFNRKGGFNVPFCRKPARFSKSYVTKICNQIARIQNIIQQAEYRFICQPYSKTIAMAGKEDIVYCDPPYIGRHADYFNTWGETEELGLHHSLTRIPCRFILSTWHSNEYRSNQYLDTIWSNFTCLTRSHFYHIGARESNRKPMLEAMITNWEP